MILYHSDNVVTILLMILLSKFPYSNSHIPKVGDVIYLCQFYKNVLSCLHFTLLEEKLGKNRR